MSIAAVRVQQPNDYGCMIACCAMVVGKTYEQVEAELHARGDRRGAINEIICEQYIGEHGFAGFKKYKHDTVANKTRDEWPPRPFAPIHVCLVDVTAGPHGVVMLADGTVLDPWSEARTTLAHPDYKAVHNVVGYWGIP